MDFTFQQYEESAQAIRARLGGFAPKVAMILGSGLGYLGDQVEGAVTVPYGEIPYFKSSTAPGHKGRLVFGTLEGQRVAVMQGRMHHYEGYSYEEVSYAVRVLRLLGCDTLIVTNAAGCVHTGWQAGDLMLITDHIKLFSQSPLRGENLPEFGVRFPDASKLYEGYSYEEVSYAVRVLRLLGCDTLIVTNAAGCVHTGWQAGDLMLITDHIKLFSQSPLRGENLPEFGVRFPDASKLYTPRLQELARQTAQEQGLTLREGVYFYCYGPQYETPAEVRAARILGGDAVGMSTAPEVVVAGHCGMEVLGITLLSNMAAGILDQPLSEREVLDAAEAAKEKFSGLIRACLRRM